MGKKLRLTLLILLFIVIGISLVIFFAMPILEGKLKTALITEFSEQSNANYELDFRDFSISILKGEIYVDSIRISPNLESLEIKHIEANSILIDGIRWISLLNQPFPKFRSVTVTDPMAELYARRISSAKKEPSSDTILPTDVNISTFDVFIQNGSGKIVQRDGQIVFSLDTFDLNTKNVDLNTILQGAYIPYLDDLFFSGSGLYWNLQKDFYQFTIDSFAFDKKEKIGKIKGLAFTPMLPKYEFSRIKAQQVDRFDLSIPNIEIVGFDLDSLFVPKVNLSTVNIQNANLEVFHDKHQPPSYGIRYKPLLHKITQEISFSFGIEQIELTNSTISYGEHLPGSENPGFISFNHLNASINNFYSAKHSKYGQDSLRFNATTLFMNASTLEIDMDYAIWDKNDNHTLNASLSAMDGTILNGMLVNTAFTKVESGFIHGLDIHMRLNDSNAEGQMKLAYENLKITVLDQKDATNTNFNTRLKSLIANTFVVKSDNIGEALRVGKIEFERPKDKAIFGYWWKSIQTGLEDSIK